MAFVPESVRFARPYLPVVFGMVVFHVCMHHDCISFFHLWQFPTCSHTNISLHILHNQIPLSGKMVRIILIWGENVLLIVHVLTILLCMFFIARLASLFGGKWSPFAKTNWKQDFTAALIGTMILIWISYIWTFWAFFSTVSSNEGAFTPLLNIYP